MAEGLSTFTGCLAGMGAALAWALGTVLFRGIGDKASAEGMNLGKCLIGTAYLGLLLAAFALAGAGSLKPLDGRTWALLSVSGVLGIALADTFFFKALICLGPRQTVVIATLAPVFTVLLGVLALKERLPPLAWVGAPITLLGVNTVLWDDAGGGEKADRAKFRAGLLYGIAFAACQALSMLTAKFGVEEASALQGTFVRLLTGAASLGALGLALGKTKAWLGPFADRALFRQMLVAVAVVAVGAFWLSMLAVKLAPVSLATVLLSTEPLFVLPITALLLKEKVTRRAVAGALIAVVGCSMILLAT
jgi:drug/metabolite transporter (DMT)-like permease